MSERIKENRKRVEEEDGASQSEKAKRDLGHRAAVAEQAVAVDIIKAEADNARDKIDELLDELDGEEEYSEENAEEFVQAYVQYGGQ